MKVNALDHVNIIAADLDRSARFYADLLDLERRDVPAPLTPQTAQWLCDANGRVILHLNSADCPRAFDRTVPPGSPTGAVHHIAFNCTGHDEAVARLTRMGGEFTLNRVDSIGLRQIFTADPDNVLLELNFFGD